MEEILAGSLNCATTSTDDLTEIDSHGYALPRSKKLRSGKRAVPLRTSYTEESRQIRLDFVEAQGIQVDQLRSMRLDPKSLRGNIESLLGAVEIPIGAAGPLRVAGSDGTDDYFAPIATTEGALVSSINRGCRALQMSGGVTARAIKQRMSRAPVFDCGGLVACLDLKRWIESQRGAIAMQIRKHSNHAVLVDMQFRVVAPCLHVRFVFETGDASGQNMTTVCTWNACNWILREYEIVRPKAIQHFMIDGNMSTDKKASRLSAIEGRGIEVVAEALLPESVIRRVLQSTSEEMTRFFNQCHAASLYTGVMGLNINVANVIAAIFTATGQDIACVHESATAQLHFETRPGGLYASLHLPSLVIGTVGGGVGLTQQKQLIEMMGCYGTGKARRFAELIASFSLALELSTAAALAGGQFATAHEKLGRNRTSTWLTREDFSPAFFNQLMNQASSDSLDDDKIESTTGQASAANPVVAAEATDLKSQGGSLVMELTSQISRRPCGLWSYLLKRESFEKNSEFEIERVFIKSKVNDVELLLAFEIMAGVSSPGLGELLREHRSDNPFNSFHIRELKIACLKDAPLVAIMPKTLGTLTNTKRDAYILAQEYLDEENGVVLLDTTEQRERWTEEYIQTAIEGIGRVHAHFKPQAKALSAEPWMYQLDRARVERLMEPHFELSRQLHAHCYDWFSSDDLEFHRRELSKLPPMWDELTAMSHTLIHGDFNPRNLAFRELRRSSAQSNESESAVTRSLIAYDWELATVHVPQRDLAEFLSFVLPVSIGDQELKAQLVRWMRLHFEVIQTATVEAAFLSTEVQINQAISIQCELETWRRGFEIALSDFILIRLPIYSIAQTFKQVPFLGPTYRMARRMLAIVQAHGFKVVQ